MEKTTAQEHIDIIFERITGTPPLPGFGEPFATAFARLHNGSSEAVTVASYTCSLFLSAILLKFPTARLHTFVHNVQEKYERFSFNCDMYERIFKEMDKYVLENVCLLQEDFTPTHHQCSKEDIFEAFDFFTNR
ncbi:MAG: hypothetical protein II198_06735 [Bacteroidaceae bacterium]|nr:hypothetical protein [Bacteroidaceae bacterium]